MNPIQTFTVMRGGQLPAMSLPENFMLFRNRQMLIPTIDFCVNNGQLTITMGPLNEGDLLTVVAIGGFGV